MDATTFTALTGIICLGGATTMFAFDHALNANRKTITRVVAAIYVVIMFAVVMLSFALMFNQLTK